MLGQQCRCMVSAGLCSLDEDWRVRYMAEHHCFILFFVISTLISQPFQLLPKWVSDMYNQVRFSQQPSVCGWPPCPLVGFVCQGDTSHGNPMLCLLDSILSLRLHSCRGRRAGSGSYKRCGRPFHSTLHAVRAKSEPVREAGCVIIFQPDAYRITDSAILFTDLACGVNTQHLSTTVSQT